jgi:hypothetical protein
MASRTDMVFARIAFRLSVSGPGIKIWTIQAVRNQLYTL